MVPDIYTHRGINLGPEQTMPAFRNAGKYGVPIKIEADVRRVQRKNGGYELVLFHDPTVDRTTNGIGPFDKYLFEDLMKLDAGVPFGQQYAGTRIPRLDEFLREFGAGGIDLDLKDPIGLEVYVAVKRLGLLDTTLFTSFSLNNVLPIKKIDPQAEIGHISQDIVKANLDTVKNNGVDIIVVQANTTTPGLIEAAHKKGLKVISWFDITDGENRGNIPDYPVDGIIDNNPTTLIIDLQELKKIPNTKHQLALAA